MKRVRKKANASDFKKGWQHFLRLATRLKEKVLDLVATKRVSCLKVDVESRPVEVTSYGPAGVICRGAPEQHMLKGNFSFEPCFLKLVAVSVSRNGRCSGGAPTNCCPEIKSNADPVAVLRFGYNQTLRD